MYRFIKSLFLELKKCTITMTREYHVFMPDAFGTIKDEWRQCLKKIENKSLEGNRPVKLNVFADIPDYVSYTMVCNCVLKDIKNCFGDNSPSVNITAQLPEKPGKISVESLFVRPSSAEIKTKFYNSLPYVVIQEPGNKKEVWGAGLGSGFFPYDTRKASSAAFEQMIDILKAEEMTLDNVVRQWNYVGNILEVKEGYQNYQIFNEVRSDYYRKYRTFKNFPSATGVGMKYGGVILDFYALKPDESIRILPVNNPLQVNAYEYNQQVLKGMPGPDKEIKNPPQFERALIVENNFCSTLFVSGTASIIGQDTAGVGDVEKQATVTIENIKRLTDPERISQITGKSGNFSGKFLLLRVYIKNQDYFSIVKVMTEKNFPGVPAVYIEADICRDDLLTETEGEMVLYQMEYE